MKRWFVYIVRCADGSLYTGIARDVERRVSEHNRETGSGARYTRTRRPVQLVYSEVWETRAEAARREYQIKQLSKHDKEVLVGS